MKNNDSTKKEKKFKLPKHFSKAYTQKQLDKLGSKIFIKDDREWILSFFKESELQDKKGNKLYTIPANTVITQKDAKRLTLISKELKTQKTRVKWIPLIAVVIFLVLVCVGFITFKNVIAKNIIVNTCESIFKAKCDVASVNFRLFDASFKVNGLQIANKKKPMKNLFQADSIVLDFDLTQALCKRLITDEVSVNGIQIDSDRTYSGDISAKLAAKKRKQQEKKENESAFMKEIHSRTDGAINTVKNSVSSLVDEYNPESVIKRLSKELKTQSSAEEAINTAASLVTKYKEKPAEYQIKIDEAKQMYEKVAAIDLKAAQKDAVKLKETIKTITSTKEYVEKLQKETKATLDDIKKDSDEVTRVSNNLKNAVTNDKKLITEQINKYKNINISEGERFLTGTLDSAVYALLGEFYPYYVKILDYLQKQKGKPTEKQKLNSMLKERAKGRDVYYRQNPPKLWIKKLAASGNNFDAKILNISTNMDRSGVPAQAALKLKINDITHDGQITVDTRSYSKDELVLVDYNLSGLPINLNSKKYGDLPGIPCLNADTDYKFKFQIFEDDGFNISAAGDFSKMDVRATPFEPAFVSTIYQNTLANIKDMNIAAQVGYRKSQGINLKIDSDMDRQFVRALQTELNARFIEIKENVKQEAINKINEYSNGAFGEINSFEDIKTKLTEFQNYTEKLSKQLDEKKKEAENYIQGKIDNTINEAKEKTNQAIEKAKDDAKEKTTQAGKDLLKGLLKQNEKQ